MLVKEGAEGVHDELVRKPDASPREARFRNTSFVIEETQSFFDHAYDAGVMGIYGRSTERRCFVLEGRQNVDFVRCSYLGLDNDPSIVRGAVDAIQQYQSLHWSCARTRLNFELSGQLEDKLCELFQARVVAFSTVMLANLGALPLLASGKLTGGHKPLVVFDRLAHASLAYHKPVVAAETECVTIAHNDMSALEGHCRHRSPVVYVADGVYSMGGSAPVKALQGLQERFDLYLYLDDAHGVSIYGDTGQGFVRSQFGPDLGNRTIIAASLGKGFGASGGILLLGTRAQEALFRRYAQPYVFSVGPNLAAVGAALASAAIHASPRLQELQARLLERVECFDRLITTSESGNGLPIRMVVVGDEHLAIQSVRGILNEGFYTSATFFPTVARGRAGVRVCLTAAHSIDEVRSLCDVLKRTIYATGV